MASLVLQSALEVSFSFLHEFIAQVGQGLLKGGQGRLKFSHFLVVGGSILVNLLNKRSCFGPVCG